MSNYNQRFPFLSIISNILMILGILTCAIGAIILFIGLASLTNKRYGFEGLILSIMTSIWPFLSGIILISYGEVIRVGLFIEDNTYHTMLTLKEMKSDDHQESFSPRKSRSVSLSQSNPANTRKCKVCGHVNPEGLLVTFCENCGQSL